MCVCVCVCVCVYKHWPSGQSVCQRFGRPGFNPRSRYTKDFKNFTSLLNTQQYKVRIKGKVEQSRERSSALPTPRCSSY